MAKCSGAEVPIEITIRDASGKSPVDFVTVAAIPYRGSTAYALGTVKGSASVQLCLKPGRYGLTATAAGRVPAFQPGVNINGSKRLELELGSPGPSVRGRMTGVHKDEAPYVRLVREGHDVGDVFYARVGSDGSYQVGVTPHFAYKIDLDHGFRSLATLTDVADVDVTVNLEGIAQRDLDRPAEAEVVNSLNDQAIPLRTTTPLGDVDDLSTLIRQLAKARLVGIGEGSHGAREHQEMRHRLLQALVERHGFSVLAIEAGFSETNRLSRFVASGEGTAEEALDSLKFWIWNDLETLQAVTWLRQYNAGRPREKQVHVYGIDMQDAEGVRSNLLTYLKTVDPEIATEVEQATPSLQWPGSRAFRQLPVQDRQHVQDLVKTIPGVFDRKRNAYVAAGGGEDSWALARQAAVVLGQAIDYYSAEHGEGGLRDQFMAENMLWVLAHEGQSARAVVWAHDGHVALISPGWPLPLGGHLRKSLGAGYISVGQAFQGGTVRAWDLTYDSEKENSVQPVLLPKVGAAYFEALLGRATARLFALDVGNATGALRAWLDQPRLAISIGSDYQSVEDNTEVVRVRELYDILIFVDTVTATYPRPAALRGPHSR